MAAKARVSGREALAYTAAAGVLGYQLVTGAVDRLVKHPDDEKAHPALQAAVVGHTQAIADMNAGLSEVVKTLRDLEKDRIAREKENELKRREYWRESQSQRDKELIDAITRQLGTAAEKPRR